MNTKFIKNAIVDYVMIIGAGILYAIALKYFVFPSKVILTGTEGIATALSYYLENYRVFIILYLIFQTALLIFGFFRVGKTFAIRSLIVILTVTCFLLFLPEFRFAKPEPENERIILVIFGGLLAGVAKAIAFRHRGSTGDEDVVGAYFAMKLLKPVGSISIFAAIISTAFGMALAFRKTGQFEAVINTLMYTSIYIFASTETLNNLYRKFKITMVSVITKNVNKIGIAINHSFNYRTYTVQEGLGGHSGESFKMVRTIITQEELPQLIDALQNADANCFYYYHDIEGISQRYYVTPIGRKISSRVSSKRTTNLLKK